MEKDCWEKGQWKLSFDKFVRREGVYIYYDEMSEDEEKVSLFLEGNHIATLLKSDTNVI